MVDSRNFKKPGNNGNKKKNQWIPLVIIIVLALIMVAVQWMILDIQQGLGMFGQ